MVKDRIGIRDQRNQQPKIPGINLIEREGIMGGIERKTNSERLKDLKLNSDYWQMT